ncbi:MAG: hypothetical protein M3Q42_08265 [Pseudomonadota bacterium]|nr:hypothetical protein [Pseudomonadota bacterium]
MKKHLALALALIAAPLATSANELNYSFIEGGYIRADLAGDSGDGLFARGSAAFGESFYGHASYQKATNDELGFDVSLDEATIGVGYRIAMGVNVDFIAEASYIDIGADVEGFGSSNYDGFRAALGVRGLMTPRLEGNLKAYYTELSDLDDGELGAQAGLVFHINQTWGIVATYDHTKFFDENINSGRIGVRASF